MADVDEKLAKNEWVRSGYQPEDFERAFFESGAKPLGDLGQLDQQGMRECIERSVSQEFTLEALQRIWGAVVCWRPWVQGLLKELRRPYGVLSTIDPVHAQALGPLPGAHPVVYSCDIGVVKPERRAFAEAAARCPVPATRVRYVDDLAENVSAARALGFRAYQVHDEASLRAALADVLVDKL